jgi:hypothetical protein
MTQPTFAPIAEADKIRPAYLLQTPLDWRATRVSDLHSPENPHGPELGVPGPDQGYALLVAEELFADRIELTPGISTKDALHGSAAVACARAARFGRAPVGKDVELALVLFGFLGDAPKELIEWRSPLFQAVSHHYLAQRRVVEVVREETLQLTPDGVRARLGDWRSLLVTD